MESLFRHLSTLSHTLLQVMKKCGAGSFTPHLPVKVSVPVVFVLCLGTILLPVLETLGSCYQLAFPAGTVQVPSAWFNRLLLACSSRMLVTTKLIKKGKPAAVLLQLRRLPWEHFSYSDDRNGFRKDRKEVNIIGHTAEDTLIKRLKS